MRAGLQFPWECIACGDAKPPKKKKGRSSDTCGDEICKRAWNKFWHRDRRAAAQAAVPIYVSQRLLGATP
jgi:hypothetical protein